MKKKVDLIIQNKVFTIYSNELKRTVKVDDQPATWFEFKSTDSDELIKDRIINYLLRKTKTLNSIKMTIKRLGLKGTTTRYVKDAPDEYHVNVNRNPGVLNL